MAQDCCPFLWVFLRILALLEEKEKEVGVCCELIDVTKAHVWHQSRKERHPGPERADLQHVPIFFYTIRKSIASLIYFLIHFLSV